MELRARYNDDQLLEFSNELKDLSRQIGFKVSARGWAYIMEQNGLINKDAFDKVNTLINNARKKGFLPIDFVAEESAREFHGVEDFDGQNVYDTASKYLEWAKEAHEDLKMDWWEGEKYYIQMVVEKVDLVTLFLPVCRTYKIPIANSKGWSSMLQRAEYARRFQTAKNKGLQCVLLYCGDHDPDGLRISEFLRKNIEDLKDIEWGDGEPGYDPEDLIIDRFGLNYDFIIKNKFSWINNLITGGKKNLASKNHKNHDMQYVQEYLRDIGERKCEANVIVTLPQVARQLCNSAISKYLGADAYERFTNKRDAIIDEFESWKEEHRFDDKIDDIIDLLENERP